MSTRSQARKLVGEQKKLPKDQRPDWYKVLYSSEFALEKWTEEEDPVERAYREAHCIECGHVPCSCAKEN